MDDWEAMMDQDIDDIELVKKDDDGKEEIVAAAKKEDQKKEEEIREITK